MPDYIGKRVGNYTIQKKLGDGGFATVYLAQHNVLEKKAAAKFLLEEWVNEPDVVSRFFDEARTMERLKDHPNIVGIMDIASAEICEREGVMPYFIMEFVDGQSLEQMIHSDQGFSLEFIIEVSKKALGALEHCHKLGVIHRDIKPSNILITTDQRVKLTDFGIAKARVNTSKTGAGLTLGSTDYMSPEQALGKRDLDHRSDIYSFGVTIYEMVVGKLPFIADNPNSVALMHIQEDAKPPIAINDAVPEKLNNLIMKAMEKKPENRFQTCQEMLDALNSLNEPDPIVEAEIPVVDLTNTPNQELPEDSIRDDKEERASATTQSSSKTQRTAPPSVLVNVIRLAAIIAGFTIFFLGAFKGYQFISQANVVFETSPSGAAIFLDGTSIGESPLKMSFRPGSYRIAFTLADYQDDVVKMDLTERQNLVLKRVLQKNWPADLEERLAKALDQYEGALSVPAKRRQAAMAEAQRKFQDFLDEYPAAEPVHQGYLDFCKKNQILPVGEAYYKEKSEKVPGNVLFTVMFGKFLMARGDAKGALNTLTKAWGIDQNSIALLNTLGDYFSKEGNSARAKQYYQLSIYLKPDQTEISAKIKGL